MINLDGPQSSKKILARGRTPPYGNSSILGTFCLNESLNKYFIPRCSSNTSLPSAILFYMEEKHIWQTVVAPLRNKYLQIRGAGPIGVVTEV